MQLLIIYGTGQGQTEKIARYIADVIRERGSEVDVLDGRKVPVDLALGTYDAVIVGASVNAGRFQRYIVEFVKTHLDQLQSMPSAFFGVSLTEADPDPKKHARAMNPITRFLEETSWRPNQIASFAGSIAYMRYHWLMRIIWRRLPVPNIRKTERSSDPAGAANYEYTDWDAVTRFANEVASMACQPAGPVQQHQ